MNKKEYLKAYREKNREKLRTQDLERYHKNKDKINELRRENRGKGRKSELMYLYGISLKDYEAMLEEQGGVCAICGGLSNGRTLDVDHNHETGEVRSLLCRRCNVTIGRVKEDIHLLEQMIMYLKHKKEE